MHRSIEYGDNEKAIKHFFVQIRWVFYCPTEIDIALEVRDESVAEMLGLNNDSIVARRLKLVCAWSGIHWLFK